MSTSKLVPDCFYAHGQALSSSVTLNIMPFLSKIRTEDISLTLKSATLVLSSTGGTANTPLAIVGDISLSDMYSARNETTNTGAPVLLHTIGVAGQSTRVCVYHTEGLENSRIVVSRNALLGNNGQLVVSYNNQLVYGDTTTVTTSHFEILLELSEVEGHEVNLKSL